MRRTDDATDRLYTVGEVAAMAGVSVRTLHHYHAIGLVEPRARTEAGYRVYGQRDLERLQEVLFFREVGVPLADIAALLDAGALDREAALKLQRDMLREKAARIGTMIATIDRALDAHREGRRMDAHDLFDTFGDFDPREYEDEVRERWGDTEAYRESARRAARYTRDDWARFKAEAEEIGLAIAALMDEGVPADDPRALDAVERARLQIDTWFYPCSHEMHAALAEMYIADPRFEATYERIRPGMARYVHDAILANAARHQG